MMTPKLYARAYRFLKIRSTESSSVAPFRATESLTLKEKEIVFQFLRYNHQVKIM